MTQQDVRYFEDLEVGYETDCGSIEVTEAEMLEFTVGASSDEPALAPLARTPSGTTPSPSTSTRKRRSGRCSATSSRAAG
jgi:hypothetical protein